MGNDLMTACTCDCKVCKNCVDKQPAPPKTEKATFSMWLPNWERERYVQFYDGLQENYDKVIKLAYSDIPDRYETYLKEESAKLLSQYSDPSDMNPDEAGSNARDRFEQDYLMHYQYHYSQLVNLYHTFEQHFRKVMFEGLNHRLSSVRTKEAMSTFSTKFHDIKALLKELNYPVSQFNSWHKIDELNKIANTYKHGDGNSAVKLDKSFFVSEATRFFTYEEQRTIEEERTYVKSLTAEQKEIYNNEKEDLIMKREHTTSLEIVLHHERTPYDTYINAIIQFWKTFPEHLNAVVDVEVEEETETTANN